MRTNFVYFEVENNILDRGCSDLFHCTCQEDKSELLKQNSRTNLKFHNITKKLEIILYKKKT